MRQATILKRFIAAVLGIIILTGNTLCAQPVSLFPQGTVVYSDVPYANDTMQKHELDIYLPANATKNAPLVIWVHGGAWMLNDKHADMGYMKQTVRSFIDSGYALASINYRYSTEAVLLGAMPVDRPDLATQASPVTYVDKNDPPFLIVQGEKDQSVPNTQSILLHSYLNLAGVKNELVIVPGAPHYGEMFDAAYIRKKIFMLLRENLK